jgi:hypothetical protein
VASCHAHTDQPPGGAGIGAVTALRLLSSAVQHMRALPCEVFAELPSSSALWACSVVKSCHCCNAWCHQWWHLPPVPLEESGVLPGSVQLCQAVVSVMSSACVLQSDQPGLIKKRTSCPAMNQPCLPSPLYIHINRACLLVQRGLLWLLGITHIRTSLNDMRLR